MIIRDYAPADLPVCRELWRALNRRHREIYDDLTIGGDDPGMEFDWNRTRSPITSTSSPSTVCASTTSIGGTIDGRGSSRQDPTGKGDASSWTPTTAARDRPDPWVVELVCDVGLRDTYGLQDGDVVAVELLLGEPHGGGLH